MKKTTIIFTILGMAALSAYITGCKTQTEMVKAKSGAQLWGENCIRCHNAPSPDTFSDVEWEVAGMHMQIRANLTEDETTKIIEFLQAAN
tara:strand:+ start:354 stop:623 length:270 start_codon:yes stop_codon:yes gene_type:complete